MSAPVKIERGQEWALWEDVITVSDVIDEHVIYWWAEREGRISTNHRTIEEFLEVYRLVKNADGTAPAPAVPNDNEYRNQDIWLMGGRPCAFSLCPITFGRMLYKDCWFKTWKPFDKATDGSPDDVLMFRDGKVVCYGN